MPVIPSIRIVRISQHEFQELSHEVMRHVFDIHNEFGRFFDERVYKRELADRMAGVAMEVSVEVIYGSFTKTLFADVIVTHSGLFEFKVVEAIHPEHRCQTIQYLLLFDLAHGKIINMQTEFVQHEFVNCHQRLPDLRVFVINSNAFDVSIAGAGVFRDQIVEILRDWGTGLQLGLYEEVLTHCLGGEEAVSSLVDVLSSHGQLAKQRMRLVAPNVAFKLTALPAREGEFELHARRLLRHTSLEAIHWANIRNGHVAFRTIR